MYIWLRTLRAGHHMITHTYVCFSVLQTYTNIQYSKYALSRTYFVLLGYFILERMTHKQTYVRMHSQFM